MHLDSLDINLLKGTKDGQELMFKNKGHRYKDSRGYLIIRVKEGGHKDFQRMNNDLIYNLKISLVQSICGFELVIKGIDGQKLIIKNYDSVIKPNHKKIIKQQGMPIIGSSNRGNLIINFDVEYPDQLDNDMKDKLAVIFDYDNKPKYNTTNANGYILCELDDLNEEYTETEHTENAERVQCAQQ
jgi:DnaJ-class molecular chaperone